MPAGTAVPEFTVRSVTLGIVMVIVFSVASTYSGLKIAQVMEAAIPISILAVGVSGLFVRKNTILENVIVQSIGGLISHWVGKSSKDKKVAEARGNRGTLLASGFIAGGALAGVLGALLNLIKTGVSDPAAPGEFKSVAQIIDLPTLMGFSHEADVAQILSLACFVGLCAYLYYDARRAKA